MTGRRTQLAEARHAGVRDAILEALAIEGGHVSRTAARLGMSRSALYRAASLAGLDLHLAANEVRPSPISRPSR